MLVVCFQDGTNRMIYAYGSTDPINDAISYHGTTRGTKSLNLITTIVEPKDPGHVKHWDFLNNNVRLDLLVLAQMF